MTVSNPHQALLFFLAAAFAQNLVLTTGLGSTLTLRLSRQRKDLALFAVSLLLFSVLTVLTFHPISLLLGSGKAARLFCPLLIIAISAFWYLLAALLFKKAAPRQYEDVRSLLPLAAINTVVTGVTLIAHHQFGDRLSVDIALAMGASVGFLFVTLLTREGVDRMQHAEMPKAFAGLPALFLYLGILALALCGFSSDISFI